MSTKGVLINSATENPFLVTNSIEREAISRGAYLQDLYDNSENDKGEIEGPAYENENKIILPPIQNVELPKSIEKFFVPQDICTFIRNNIPLPGKTNFYGSIRPTILGDSTDRGYNLNLSIQQWNRKITQNFGFGLERGEEIPEIKEYFEGINNYLINNGYNSRVRLEENILEVNGYKDNLLRKEKMDEIKKRRSDKIPLMREFLVTNFPNSNYGEGEEHDLLKKSATAVEMRFNEKYSYVKNRCKNQ